MRRRQGKQNGGQRGGGHVREEGVYELRHQREAECITHTSLASLGPLQRRLSNQGKVRL
jgi:hypothetical protein